MQVVFVISSILLWVVVLLNLILTLALVQRVSGRGLQQLGLKPGTRAPDFTAETLGGEVVSMASYSGRAVTFLFIGPRCGPCREALPYYEALGPFARQAGVELVLVSNEDAAATQALVDEFKITLPVLVAPQDRSSFLQEYKATGTPGYCMVNADGIVQSAGYPSLERGEWKQLTDEWKQSQPRVAGQARAWT